MLASFAMYEVLWAVVELQFDDAYFDLGETLWDLAQCSMFTAVVFVVNWAFSKFRGGRYARSVAEIGVLLIVNAAVIFLVDKVINERDAADVGFWSVVDIYIICVICSLISIIDLQHSFHTSMLKMRQEQTLLRLNLLQQQLSPHFMFNSLSTLQGAIAADPQMAEEYLDNLSDAMRYITENVGRDRVDLSDALSFIESYMRMLNVRFPGHFVFKIHADDMPKGAGIVPVSMQIAVENAIKHNAHSARQPLHIDIRVKTDSVEVSNSRQPLPYDSGLGVGIENLGRRYQLLIGRGIMSRETQESYAIEIPLIYD